MDEETMSHSTVKKSTSFPNGNFSLKDDSLTDVAKKIESKELQVSLKGNSCQSEKKNLES